MVRTWGNYILVITNLSHKYLKNNMQLSSKMLELFAPVLFHYQDIKTKCQHHISFGMDTHTIQSAILYFVITNEQLSIYYTHTKTKGNCPHATSNPSSSESSLILGSLKPNTSIFFFHRRAYREEKALLQTVFRTT
jgi:hypothetical protein